MLDAREAEKNFVLKFRSLKLSDTSDFKGSFRSFDLNGCAKVKYRLNSLNHSRIGFVIPKNLLNLLLQEIT